MKQSVTGRRNFLKASALVAAAPLFPALSMAHAIPGYVAAGDEEVADDTNIIGPKAGYSPQVGTLVSMMAWLRPQVVSSVKGLTTDQLDFLLDDKANSIGALLYHLAATDAFYHEHTFKGLEWGKWDKSIEKKFSVAMELGDEGRKQLKGKDAGFYLALLEETRQNTLTEFKKRDDKWFMTVDDKWPWGPTNNYCKWFHVCEHESHHLGQIGFLKSRLPGAKAASNG